MKNRKVVVAGHACIDVTPKFMAGVKGDRISDILAPGKLINMDGIEINGGGAVSNTGIAMKMLGCDVKLAAKIGTDDFGTMLKNLYAARGITEGIIQVEGEHTSYSIVIAVPGIDRIFLHDPGCNNTFGIEDIKKVDFSDVSLFHLGYPPVMRKLYLHDGEELAEIYRYVKSKGVVTSLDLAAVDPNSEAGKADWRLILQKVLPYVDFFMPSVEELCWMLDKKKYAEWSSRAAGGDMVKVLEPEKDIRPLTDACLQMGVKAMLLKCGSPGLYYATAEGSRLGDMAQKLGLSIEDWGGKSGFERSYRPGKVLSATGAGDTTIAAFLTAVLSGYDFTMCIHLAAAQGASCVEAYDALGGIKPLKELKEKIEAGWEKQ